MRVGHKVDERTLQARALAAQHIEAALRQLHAALEVDDAQLGAKIPMRLRLEVELGRRAPTAHLGVLAFILADRRGLMRHVGHVHHELGKGRLGLVAAGRRLRQLVVDLANALLGGLGLVLLAFAHHLADRLRRRIALSGKLLFLRDGGAALLVKRQEALAIELEVARAHRLDDGIQVFANEFEIKHGLAPWVWS